MGGGAVLLNKPRAPVEVYNDLGDEVVNVFRVARDHGAELKRALQLTPYAEAELRAAHEKCPDRPVEQARRTIVRALQGFSTAAMYREENTTGFRRGHKAEGGGGEGGAQWRNYINTLDAVLERLQGVVIEQREATDVLLTHDAEDALHYVDPPYTHDTREHTTAYPHEMSNEQHERLAEVLHTLKGAVVLSGYDNPLYARLYKDWRRVCKDTVTYGGSARVEVLWCSRRVQRGLVF